jgi:hypothetical protein
VLPLPVDEVEAVFSNLQTFGFVPLGRCVPFLNLERFLPAYPVIVDGAFKNIFIDPTSVAAVFKTKTYLLSSIDIVRLIRNTQLVHIYMKRFIQRWFGLFYLIVLRNKIKYF